MDFLVFLVLSWGPNKINYVVYCEIRTTISCCLYIVFSWCILSRYAGNSNSQRHITSSPVTTLIFILEPNVVSVVKIDLLPERVFHLPLLPNLAFYIWIALNYSHGHLETSEHGLQLCALHCLVLSLFIIYIFPYQKILKSVGTFDYGYCYESDITYASIFLGNLEAL